MRRLYTENSLLIREICLASSRRLMAKFRKGLTRMTKNPARPFAVDGYESQGNHVANHR